MDQHEREVIADFIEIYRSMPCLWDLSSEAYKDPTQKRIGWEILVKRLREIDPNANEASAKKKIEHLKSSYHRELKKVRDSKLRSGSDPKEIHKPNLWYFNLLTFLDKKKRNKTNFGDSHISENEEDVREPVQELLKEKKGPQARALELKKQKLIDTAQELLQDSNKRFNAFGMYVGEKLDQIPPGQQEIAEKLISDVIFLARTNNLSYDSRIETPSKSQISSHSHSPHYNPSPYLVHSSPSIQISQSPRTSSDTPSNKSSYLKQVLQSDPLS